MRHGLYFTPDFCTSSQNSGQHESVYAKFASINHHLENRTMHLTPTIAIHIATAIGAVVIGPVAIWARKGNIVRTKLHRAFGYAWVTLMIMTAISAIFIRDFRLPNINGYTLIHLLVVTTFACLFAAFYFLAKGNIRAHQRFMTGLYFGACIVAGGFTLIPGRYLGNLLWG
jgi:uncharacterized membrane protein